MDTLLRIGVLTVSDRASTGEYEDLGGPAIVDWLSIAIASPWEAVNRLVPDDQKQIEMSLRDLVDNEHCQLVFTTGGTGPAPRGCGRSARRRRAPSRARWCRSARTRKNIFGAWPRSCARSLTCLRLRCARCC